ncbi:uncharacterized protein LOC118277957 [Spodoptera frugiperda]|uniref:Uncharacterized protein LOC118277957 n=1 Tax=Spodoptera frugiperda TaxID=7108 RepID=A0A9R0DGZ4_SPOFR|nr:uncharacterized protein LOC118277957 [Spodoptera frugiperda]
MTPKSSSCCGINLRPLCFMIGYLHLLSSVVDVVCHLLTVAIVTNGFQCDVNNESLQAISIPWLEPLLIVLNLGTHGFYPYPRVFRNQYHIYVEQMSVASEPKCYPGMLHIYLIDLLNFLINLIWLRIVVSYVGAVHKKNPEPMRMFLSLSVVKLVMQAMYFGYQPFFYDVYTIETVWFLKLTDILIAVFFLIIVQKYTKALRLEKAATQNIEKPPSYIECLINGHVRPPSYELKDEVTIVDEERKQNVENADKS